MNNKFNYSFDDEKVSKFSYDYTNKKIEIQFTGYFDLLNNSYIEKNCVFVIENWKEAKSSVNNYLKLQSLDENIGLFTIIYYMEFQEEDILKIFVNTIDNRYVEIFFKEPKLSLIEL